MALLVLCPSTYILGINLVGYSLTREIYTGKIRHYRLVEQGYICNLGPQKLEIHVDV